MTTFKITADQERFTLYFDTPNARINAYALATALVGLADAVKEVNLALNIGADVELVVEALKDGSFKATVRTVFTQAKSLFGAEAIKAIILSVIATHIYEKGIKSDPPPIITVSPDLVVIEIGKDKFIVPRDVYEAKKQIEKSTRFNDAIGKVFTAAQLDTSVQGLGFTPGVENSHPSLIVPRENFGLLRREPELEEDEREILEQTRVEISRAILERNRRKWEFFWNGVKVAAPILDGSFFDKFFAHEITIAPGDALDVTLRIIQRKHPDLGIYINSHYEVLFVHNHIPREKQASF
jgi:hypothetical protein